MYIKMIFFLLSFTADFKAFIPRCFCTFLVVRSLMWCCVIDTSLTIKLEYVRTERVILHTDHHAFSLILSSIRTEIVILHTDCSLV